MQSISIRRGLLSTCAALLFAACSAAEPADDALADLLGMHEQVLEAHRTGDIELWLSMEADTYVSANGGRITFPTRTERRAMREPYLSSTEFDVYRDLRDPVIELSPDGQLGWVIAQVEVRGTQTTDSAASPIEDVWAWVELYRKIDGEWKLVGNVSNRQE